MQFTTAFAGLLLTSIAIASPVANIAVEESALEARDVTVNLCQVGVPCIVQYEVNTALKAVDEAVALVQADVKAVLLPIGPVVVALNVAATALIEVAVKLNAEVTVLVGDAKTQLAKFVVSAIAALIVQIRAGVTIVLGVEAGATATVSAEVSAAASAIIAFIAAIEAVVGPCPPPA